MTLPSSAVCPPVLFIIFNRPATTQRVMESLRQARPRRLYIAADGPRTSRPEEAKACEQARQVASSVDWPCEVKTLFRDRNLGCRLSVSSAIDWLFEHENEGIILEDDVVPAESFFPFCAELLKRYRNDKRISMIGGANFQVGVKRGDASYYFSRMHHVWGWATWRRAWRKYDLNMTQWPGFKRSHGFRRMGVDRRIAEFFTPSFDATFLNQLDTWDYQWVFTGFINDSLAIIPQANMVTNIGFGSGATHTRSSESWQANMIRQDIIHPLVHPKMIFPDQEADLSFVARARSKDVKTGLRALARRIKRRVRRMPRVQL